MHDCEFHTHSMFGVCPNGLTLRDYLRASDCLRARRPRAPLEPHFIGEMRPVSQLELAPASEVEP